MKTLIFWLLLFCAKSSLSQDWIRVEQYEAQVEDIYAGDEAVELDDTLSRPLRSVASDTDDIQSADSEEAEVVSDEDGKPRDKRTLGLIVQGLASALGYTLTPVQVASLPNPSPPPAAPPAPPAPKTPVVPSKAPAPAPPPRPPPPAARPAKAPAAPPARVPAPPPQPRQRETIRITGLVNFGPNANANLPAQLGQYEQLFHGNAVGAAPATPVAPAAPAPPAPARPAPAPAPAPAPVPVPVPKSTLARIPSPIVPNLSPLLPPSRPPISIPGKIPTKPKAGSPTKQEVETEYRKQENVDYYNVENKEIQGDGNPFLETPRNAYVQEPDWQQSYIAKLRELEERQKEYADKLEKHEALLVQQQQDHESTDERFVNREKEILERDKVHTDRLRDREPQNVSQKDKDRSNPDVEDSSEEYEEGDRTSGGYKTPSSSANEGERPYGYEDEEERVPKQYFEYNEEPRKYLDYQDSPQKYGAYDSEDDDKLPISRNNEASKSKDVRNSYGESLEDQGRVNENIADYFVKFKDPKTGLYVPEKTQNAGNYNKEEQPWWKGNQDEFEGRLEHLRREYSSPAPESKYEEYELEEEPEESNKSAEKLERSNEADEKTSRPNNPQKIPDYSEAFGGHEPYVDKLEPKHSQEIVSPSTDTAESPRSELKGTSNGESERSEKSEDETEIPLYHFDFKSFMPYHSPIKYFYASDEAESGVPQVQSYNQNSGAPHSAELTNEDLPVEREESREEHQPTIGLPEKLTMKNLHDGESKELRAWPAPFDYVFDSTEQTNVAELPSNQRPPETEVAGESNVPYPSEELHAPPVRYLVPEYESFFRSQHGTGQQEGESGDYHGHLVRAQSLQQAIPRNDGFQEYARFSSALDAPTQQSQVPSVRPAGYNSQEDNRRMVHDERKPQTKINEQRILEPTELQNHQYISSNYPFVNHQRSYESNTRAKDGSSQPSQTSSRSSPGQENLDHDKSRQRYQPVESQYHREIPHGNSPISQNGPRRYFGPVDAELRNRGPDISENYTPSEPRLSGRRFDENPNHQPQKQEQVLTPHQEDRSLLKFDDPKSAHDFFGFSHNDYDYESNGKNAKTQSIGDNDESLDLPVVSDPMPYDYDVKLTEYTDKPESDTEKVKVKEYRNQIATVTVSENKQLSPEGPVHHIGYLHHY